LHISYSFETCDWRKSITFRLHAQPQLPMEV
jgi:hypothetical protein